MNNLLDLTGWFHLAQREPEWEALQSGQANPEGSGPFYDAYKMLSCILVLGYKVQEGL